MPSRACNDIPSSIVFNVDARASTSVPSGNYCPSLTARLSRARKQSLPSRRKARSASFTFCASGETLVAARMTIHPQGTS
jgi:hypothetical protein